jgi:NADPH:quinone reductase-like Zn-dependent oxidoreductase
MYHSLHNTRKIMSANPAAVFAAPNVSPSSVGSFNQVIISKRGGPDVLKLVTRPMVEPGPGEVRVKIAAAGVAFADVLMREGLGAASKGKNIVPGYDIVGTIDATGPMTPGWRVGQHVAALTTVGGYSEYLCIPIGSLVPVPDGVDAAEAVALVLNFLTAYQMLHRCRRVRAGDRILIHGAGGGVGDALMQLGRIAGLRMFGTATKAKHPALEAHGAIPIDYKNADFVERTLAESPTGVDAVFDPIGGTHWARSARTLNAGGMLIGYGFSAATKNGRRSLPRLIANFLRMPRFHLLQLFNKTHAIMGYNVNVMKRAHPDWYREDLSRIFELLAAGSIRPNVAARLPLSQASRAHELLNTAAVTGKLVLVNPV